MLKTPTADVFVVTKADMDEAQELAQERLDLCKRKGWKNRHTGLDPRKASIVGELGEIMVRRWLTQVGLPFTEAPKLVESLSEIRQDFIVYGRSIGVKTIKDVEVLARYHKNWLYPAKYHLGETRVLGYPAALIQACAHPTKVWLLGWVRKAQIVKAPVRAIYGKPTHEIPQADYLPLDQLVTALEKCAPVA